MTILITGGAGFIGHTLTHHLLSQGHRILLVDNLNDTYDPAIKWQHLQSLAPLPNWRLYEGDIRNVSFLGHVFRANTVDGVIHLAGLTGVRASLQDPAAYFDQNIKGTSVLLEAMRTAGVNRLVFASSSSVYGARLLEPFRETDAVDTPVSPYALSKRAAELLCYQHHHLYGLHAYCMRLFTVYGPHQRPDMAISRFISQLHANQPISLFGDGLSQRDYTYVADIVAGLSQAILRVEGYELINLGSANPVTLLDVIAHLESLTNRRVPIRWLADQPGDVPNTFASIDKAQRLLNYQPATSLREGLQRMVAVQTLQATPILT